MRLNYYRFPETVEAHTRYQSGAVCLQSDCVMGEMRSAGCPHLPGGARGCRECPHFKCEEAEDTIGGITVTAAKQLLRKFGGSAWTDHCERDGGVFETSEIKLTGNNSRFKYNRHL